MIGVPGLSALSGSRRPWVLLLLVALLYWIMIGFRFQVGSDWNNYIFIYDVHHQLPLRTLLGERDPGYGVLTWVADQVGGGILFVNAVSGLVFTWGMFAVARRCPEPMIAVCVATPLLAVAFAMSAVRQAIAAGIIFHLMSTWDRRSMLARVLFILLAASFHFSAIFMLCFVALATKVPAVIRVTGALILAFAVLFVIRLAPDAMESYSRLYVGSQQRLSAPGAIVQTGAVAMAALIYFATRSRWIAVNGDNPLYRNMAYAAVLSIPAILISSVGAYRFALYLWPMAMWVYSGIPSMIPSGLGRLWCRLLIVLGAIAVLAAWLLLANNSIAWFPYSNWLFHEGGVRMTRAVHG